MNCVLRISGTKLDVDAVEAVASAKPYRVDVAGSGRAKSTCLHYDIPIPTKGGSRSDDLAAGLTWVQANMDLAAVATRRDVDSIELDCGIVMAEGQMSVTATIGPEVMAAASRMGVSVTISVYRGD